MKRKLVYLLALLVILAGALGPALYMHKVFRPPSGPNSGRSVAAAKQGNPVANKENSPSAGPPQESPAPSRVSGPSGTAPASESGCRVWIAVVGEKGEFLFRPRQIIVQKDNKWGITALGALDATGLSYTTIPTWPDFVDSAGGQADRGMAGWMYSVNGEVPMHMADKQPVKTGDKVIWWYSKSMDQPPPLWQEMVQKK